MPNSMQLPSPVRICVVTGSRSEYGLMRWLMEDLKRASDFHLQVVVSGSHLSEEHGSTYREIENDGFDIDARIPFRLNKTDPVSVSQATGTTVSELARVFTDLKPDLVMVMGDRYELLSVLTVCVVGAIPLAHISGGEITEGAIDEQIRHAMTKASHLHYVANEVYGARVCQMGEEKWRVCICGEPGLDNLHRQSVMSVTELAADIGVDTSKPTALVTYHPVTLERDDLDWQISELMTALDDASSRYDLQYVITYPNADVGYDRIIEAWDRFIDGRADRILIKSLGQSRYLSALNSMSMMIGNSSSGLVEAPSFNMPVVNIGTRQQGRMRGKNVIDVDYSRAEIAAGIESALAWDRSNSCFNPYGDGHSSGKVLKHLRYVFTSYSRNEILSKKFLDMSEVVEAENNFYRKCGDLS
jgi:UDP-hydrolysing UDP-N-acetyl-D-glucosamine 2-epimerase